MNIKLLDNGAKVRIKLDAEYREILKSAIQHVIRFRLQYEYDIALGYETMRALSLTPTRLRLSEFLFAFSELVMSYVDEPTQHLIRIHLDLDKFLTSRIPQALTQNLLQHG